MNEDKRTDIEKAVDNIIDIYFKEDYDYMVSLAKEGERPEGIDTIAEEAEFIKRNNLGNGLSDKDIVTVAGLALEKIKSIDNEAFARYNK